jgi:hypothetical protein
MIASKISAKQMKINDGKRAMTASSNSCEKKRIMLLEETEDIFYSLLEIRIQTCLK